MNRMFRILIAVMVVTVFGSIFIAQTQDNANPNEPRYPNAMLPVVEGQQFCDATGANPTWPPCNTSWDNECELGGQMEGRCETEYDWQLGWWSARFNQGHLTREQIPANFQHNFPNSVAPQSVNDNPSVPTNTLAPTNTLDPSLPTSTPTNTSIAPTDVPTDTPTNTSVAPTDEPTETPTNTPTDEPTSTPTNTDEPTETATPI